MRFRKFKISDPEAMKVKQEKQRRQDILVFLRASGLPPGYLLVTEDEYL